MPHGNSHRNQKLHHLYEIRDTQEDEVYKYGISAEEIEEDGLSARHGEWDDKGYLIPWP